MTTYTDHQTLTSSSRIVALTAVQARLPFAGDRSSDMAYLAGIGLLIADQGESGWTFDMRIGLATLDQGDAPLLTWAANALPADAHVVGWQLAETSIAMLQAAAADAEPELACAFLDGLVQMVRGGSSDLAVEHGGAGAPAFQTHAGKRGLLVHPLAPDAVFEAYHSARTAPVQSGITSELLALMHLAMLAAGPARSDARRDFGRWVADQRALGAQL